MVTHTKDLYINKILNQIKEKRNVDFSGYRQSLLARRVMGRVLITKCGNTQKYYAYLRHHHGEMDYLMDVMTINVTEFFRDRNVFNVIEKKVIPDLFKKKEDTGSNVIHIWSCGCSSGEEAYSVLMLIAEYLKSRLADYKLTIFGTDIDTTALAKANEAVYELSQFKNLSPEKKALVDKYFYNMNNKRYWIREEWPAYMNFHYHDAMADAPLEHMDMILCRNVFIYFDRELQNSVLERFWRSLDMGGFLVMGIVESILGPMCEKFKEFDKNARIYVKK